jgi:hypothetical protein
MGWRFVGPRLRQHRTRLDDLIATGVNRIDDYQVPAQRAIEHQGRPHSAAISIRRAFFPAPLTVYGNRRSPLP